MALQEVVPRPLPALRAGVETFLLQNLDHRRTRDRTDAKALQLAQNAGVAEAAFAGDPHDEGANVRGGRATAGASSYAPRFPLGLQPAQKGPRRDNGDQVLDGRPQLATVAEQPLPLPRSHVDAHR